MRWLFGGRSHFRVAAEHGLTGLLQMMVLERTQKPRNVSRIRVGEHLQKLCLVAIPGRFRRRDEWCGSLGLLCENLVDVEALAFETAKRRREHGHEQEHIL